MAIKRYTANANSTITNAYKYDLTTRATASNMSKSDILEVFSLYGQSGRTGSSEIELSRILVNFPVSDITDDINAGIVPANTKYILRLFNAPHSETLPSNFTLTVQPVSRAWAEGTGLDMETYLDTGGVTWVSASNSVAWTNPGGDYTGAEYTESFDTGLEDLEVDISTLVASWYSGSLGSYGVGLRLSGSLETQLSSTYTKRFFARGTEFFFKKPVIEARWDDFTTDQRNNFFASSSANPDNLNTIHFNNIIRGVSKDVPGIGSGDSIYVDLYDARSGGSKLNSITFTGSWQNTGSYVVLAECNTTSSYIYDRWYNSGLTTCYYTGSIRVKQLSDILNTDYVIQSFNFKQFYDISEKPRFRFSVRRKNWNPTIYTVSKEISDNYESVEEAYYRIIRVADNFEVFPFSYDSAENFTRLSYDSMGNYFDFEMSQLEPGYRYGIQIGYVSDQGDFKICPQTFNFRVI